MESLASVPTFRLALALQFLSSKPAQLSVREYAHLLRNHISPAPTSPRSLDAESFWRNRATEAEKRTLQLEGRVTELEAGLPPPTKRRKLGGGVKTGGGREWENALEVLMAGAKEEVGVARVLWFVSDPRLVVAALEKLAEGMGAVGTEGRWTLMRKMVEVLVAMKASPELQVQGTVAVVKMLLSMVREIIRMTGSLLEGGSVQDSRMQTTKMLVGLFKGLQYKNEVERWVLEGFCAGLLDIIRGCLGMASGGSKEKVLAEEAGWYLLVLLEGVWGMGKKHCGGLAERIEKKLGDRLEERLKESWMELVESVFVMGVAEVVGFDALL